MDRLMNKPLTNADRAKRAHHGVNCYVEVYDNPSVDSLDAWIGDLLTDLRHLCDREGFDFDRLSELGAMHHKAELQEDSDEFDVEG